MHCHGAGTVAFGSVESKRSEENQEKRICRNFEPQLQVCCKDISV